MLFRIRLDPSISDEPMRAILRFVNALQDMHESLLEYLQILDRLRYHTQTTARLWDHEEAKTLRIREKEGQVAQL